MQALAVLPARTHSGHSTSLQRGAPGPGSKSARARTTRLRTGILKHGDRVIYISRYYLRWTTAEKTPDRW